MGGGPRKLGRFGLSAFAAMRSHEGVLPCKGSLDGLGLGRHGLNFEYLPFGFALA
jgi:hypothetical protein